MMNKETIKDSIKYCIDNVQLPLDNKYKGKVRDTYDLGKDLLIITTDRQSAFDRLLGHIPFKGQVLNQISLFWFEKTKHIIDNHILDSPDANAVITKKCKVLPIEFIVRGYITGSTNTSLWYNYKNGARSYCGHNLPDGLQKNQKLEKNIVTPTTKEQHQDRLITPNQTISEGWLTKQQWDFASQRALELFEYGQKIAKENGLILADTKYEFGIDENDNIILIDEIHTPDSSRYWISEGYDECFENQQEPHMIDKEFFRLWFRQNCNPYSNQDLPQAPSELVVELSSRYIELFERITNQKFIADSDYSKFNDRIINNVKNYMDNNLLKYG